MTIFFTPGPSQIYPTVKKHLENALINNIPSISHRSKDFEKIFEKATNELQKLLNIPSNYRIFFISSATEAMERIIQNSTEEKSFHLINGAFSNKFYEISIALGKTAYKKDVEYGQGFDMNDIEIPDETELICITHNETSTGVMLEETEIEKLAQKNPDKLIALDIVSSVPFTKIDYNLIDFIFFSVQKGFGLPAGLGVLIVSPRAIEKSKELSNTGSYHNFESLLKYADKNQTPETPNVTSIYLLGQVTEDMNKLGIDAIRGKIEEKAKLIYDFLGKSDKYFPFVKEAKFRSKTVIAIDTKENPSDLIERLKEKGIIIGKGYGQFKETQIRIANFPATSIEDMELLLGNLLY